MFIFAQSYASILTVTEFSIVELVKRKNNEILSQSFYAFTELERVARRLTQ
jgi:hypothetical protein